MPTPAGEANGPAFREARELAGLPLRALARHVGKDFSHLSRWERDLVGISPELREAVTTALARFQLGEWSPT
jgi:transcriptional regulator with XRE-family HTH domain